MSKLILWKLCTWMMATPTGPATTAAPQDIEAAKTLPNPLGRRYVSFSGGGWNSHSFLAGMLSGSLDALEKAGKERSLSTLLKGVEGISANSGGTWFLAQLVYSAPFSNAFESLGETNKYKTTGYNGQTRKLFEPSFKTKQTSILELPRVIASLLIDGVTEKEAGPLRTAVQSIDYYRNLINTIGKSDLNWRNLVEGLVYKPYNMTNTLSGLNLSSPRQPWAKDKDLLYGTALFSAPVVMEGKGLTEVLSNVSNAGVASGSQFTPMTITSEVIAPGSTPLAKVLLGGGDANLTISNSALSGPQSVVNPVASRLTASGLNVMDPTIASSSAGAMVASPNSWAQRHLRGAGKQRIRNELSELTRGLAPIAQLSNGTMTMPRALPVTSTLKDSINKLSSGFYTRMADGGYVDNISATNMLRHIQDTDGTAKPFTLTLFSNTSSDPVTGIRMQTGPNQLSTFTLPSDLSGLFGNTDGKNNDQDLVIFPDGGFNIKVPSNKIFDASAWYNKKQPDWRTESGNIDISYYKLNVKTVENKAFVIKPGQSGTVNIFVARNRNSGPGPFKPQYLDSYDNNFDAFRNAISSGGAFPYIKDAFGLVT